MIESFYKLRLDGQVITEQMSGDDIYDLGEISPVVEVRWVCNGELYSVSDNKGVLGEIVAGREYLAVRMGAGGGDNVRLVVYHSGGRLLHEIPRQQWIKNAWMTGEWASFEVNHDDHHFDVIFLVDGGPLAYRLTINARTGETVNAVYVRY